MVESVKYGITAVRFAGAQVVEAMMGLIDASQSRWDLRPAPTRVSEVVDRLVAAMKKDDYRIQSLVYAIAASAPFGTK